MAAKKKKRISPQRAYEKRNKLKGLCVVCPDPATHGQFCRRHYNRYTRNRRKRLGCKRKYKSRY